MKTIMLLSAPPVPAIRLIGTAYTLGFFWFAATALAAEPTSEKLAQSTPGETQPAAGEVTVLPEMEVIGSTTATKTELPVFETPFTIDVVPREVIEQQNVIFLEDALKNVSSVFTGFENGNNQDNFTIRGIDVDFVYRDGVRLRIPQIDPAGIEHIDVLKGAAASNYGRIEPGGLINVITKKPLAEPHYSIEQQIAEHDFYRTEIDATGPITADKSWLYRTVFAYQNNDSFRDNVENEHVYFFPSLTWSPSDRTQFNLGVEYADFEDTIDYGIPAIGNRPAPVPIENFYGVADAGSDTKFYLVDFNWSHAFTEDWAIKHKFAWYLRDREYIDSGPQAVRIEEGLVDIFASFPYGDTYEAYFTELDLTGRFDLVSMTHSVLFGAEYYKDKDEQSFLSADSESETIDDKDGVIPIRPLDLNNPVYQRSTDLPAITGTSYDSPISRGLKQRESWYAVFAQDFIDVTDKLSFIFFSRYDIARSRTDDCTGFKDPDTGSFEPCTPEGQQIEDEFFSPRVGLSYDIQPWLTFFGNYAESFGSPAGGILADGSPAGYEEGEQYEVGLKAQTLDQRLVATLSFYHLIKSNVALQVPVEDFQFQLVDQAGEVRSRGIELDVVGRITDSWNIIASYAYTDAEITEDQAVVKDPVLDELGAPVLGADGNPLTTPVATPGNTGNRLPNAPRQAFSIWNHYQLPIGLGLGIGVFGATKRALDPGNAVFVPGFVRVDAAASYRWKLGPSVLTAQLNVFNLLDKEIFDPQSTFTATVNATPVAPRTVLGSLRLEW
ncbi:MAG: TonB-dependent siderophore receptor [Gammaproteobacteria bacterium]